jgi:predicted ribosome quality control (RQC) complex YloA/Tae2 family protein
VPREEAAAESLADAKAAARSPVVKARARLVRRAEAIRGDIARVAEAVGRADVARWFVVPAARAPRGTRELVVTDWSSGEPRRLAFACDPAKLPREEVEAAFARARRMQRGKAIADARLAETLAAVARLDATLEVIDAAPSQEAVLAAIAPDPSTIVPPALYRELRPKKGQRGGRLPYRAFSSAPGVPIYAGRGAEDNDALTFHVARPRDLWLHVRGAPGSHVVLPLMKGKEPTPEALVDAAHLAAHFSSLRGEPTVEIEYAPRGRVRKPRGSPPGLVVVDQGRTMLVRVEPERLKRLLATEEGS